MPIEATLETRTPYQIFHSELLKLSEKNLIRLGNETEQLRITREADRVFAAYDVSGQLSGDKVTIRQFFMLTAEGVANYQIHIKSGLVARNFVSTHRSLDVELEYAKDEGQKEAIRSEMEKYEIFIMEKYAQLKDQKRVE